MNDSQKVRLFYEAYGRHPEARVGTVVQRINRMEKTEKRTAQLRSELDAASDRRARLLADAERGETVLQRFFRIMGVR